MPILAFQIALLLPKIQSLAKRNIMGCYLHSSDHAGIVGLVKLLLNIPSAMKIFIIMKNNNNWA